MQLQATGMPLPSGMAQYLHPYPSAVQQTPHSAARLGAHPLPPALAAPATLAGMGANAIIEALRLDRLQSPGAGPGAKRAAPAGGGGGDVGAAPGGFADVGDETLDALRSVAEHQEQAFTTPGKGRPAEGKAPQTGVPSPLQGWTCMSPPPNFQLPDDFAASPAAAQALPGPGAGSELSRLVGMALPASLMAFPGGEPAAGQPTAPAAAVLQKGVDALFRQMSFAAAGNPVAGGGNSALAAALPAQQQAAQPPAVAPNRDTRLTFGSLLADGTDSQTGGNSNWMEQFAAGQSSERGGAEQPPPALPVGNRPFSSLFGK